MKIHQSTVFLILAVLFCSSHAITAQSDKRPYPKVNVGINLFNLAHARTPALDFVIEIRLDDRFSIRFDGGPMLRAFNSENLIVNSYSGWQVGVGGRFYLTHDVESTYDLFLELRGKFKNYAAHIDADFFRNNVNGIYQERLEYVADAKEYNMQVGFGQAFQFDHFRLDFIVGLGLAEVNINYLNIPDDADFRTNGTSVWRPDENYDPYPSHLFFMEWIFGYSF